MFSQPSTSKPSYAQLREKLLAQLADPERREKFFGFDVFRRCLPELAYGRHQGPARGDARPAAVLALLYPKDGVWHLPALVRPDSMQTHAGQIALPGGMLDEGEVAAAGAVREYQEELGASVEGLEVLGELAPVYVFNSNFLVTPILALAAEAPQFSPNEAEVQELLEIPVGHLAMPEQFGNHPVHRRGLVFQAPHFLFEEKKIWGATSLILAEVLGLLSGKA